MSNNIRTITDHYRHKCSLLDELVFVLCWYLWIWQWSSVWDWSDVGNQMKDQTHARVETMAFPHHTHATKPERWVIRILASHALISSQTLGRGLISSVNVVFRVKQQPNDWVPMVAVDSTH